MMKISILIIVLLVCGLTGCRNDKSHVGVYHRRDDRTEITILRDDGTFEVKQNNGDLSGKYRLKHGKLDLIMNGNTVSGKIVDGVIYDDEGKAWDKADREKE